MNEQPKKRKTFKFVLIAATFAIVGVLAIGTLRFSDYVNTYAEMNLQGVGACSDSADFNEIQKSQGSLKGNV